MSTKFKSFLIFSFLIGIIFLSIPNQSLAAVNTGVNQVDSSIALSNTGPLKVATNVINILMSLLSLVAVCLILWGGFLWMTSNGSEEKVAKAKKILINSAIGLVIILSAWGITYFILKKLVGATGGQSGDSDNCTSGTSVSCGCGGAQTCNGGTWGACIGSTCDPTVNDKTSCDGKTAVDKCQADDSLCGNDYFCDTTSCLCKIKSSLGQSCNASSSGKCVAADNLCGPYLKCDPNSCVCVGSPVITGISPSGGFCTNNSNQGCNQDSDCSSGAKCDTSTPNGTANNFVTIYGYNFGTTTKMFDNVLSNVDFEKVAANSVPEDWTTTAQKHSSVGVVSDQYKSSKQSVKLHQDANLIYPGTCNKSICQDMSGCTWSDTAKTCSFLTGDDGHKNGPAVYTEGQTFYWPNTNHNMFAKLTYNLAPLNFKVGDTYSVQFFYKGKISSNVSVQIGTDLGWTTMCAGYSSYNVLKAGYSWDGTKVTPTPAAGEDPCNSGYGKTCANQSNFCCVNAPYQTKCYQPLSLTSIPAGTKDDWTLYSYTFQYTPEMDSWVDKNNNKKIELGLSVGYNSTGAGTDLYVDDFTVTKVLSSGQVTFLGTSSNQAQLANFPKLLNANCISYWSDREVTVAVPSGAASGPIEIKREGDSSDNTDTTNNEVGPVISDFVKNDISRPGLCQINPTEGVLGDKVVYQGINLKNSAAYFGAYTSSYKGINSNFTADNLSGQTMAPSIIPGKTTTFVEQSSTGVSQKSNALIFVKEKDPAAGPYIASFYPTTGTAGQYITILGSGFGNLRGSRQVFFGDQEASYDFPDVCASSIWSDNQIVVKVPSSLKLGNYEIKINLGDQTINTDLLSPNNTFKFDPTQSLKTSLCKIDPNRGQIGDKVSLWGEYFGNSGTNASVVFTHNVSISSKITKDGKADKIETEVPTDTTKNPAEAAITGPVHVLKNGEWGNELNFSVGKCSSNSECNSSSPICCPDNTYKSGSCEASLLSCYFDVPNSVYETKFNTVLTTNPGSTKFDSCSAMATFYNGCQTGQFCPNSPGKCSPFNPILPEVVGSCGAAASECGTIDYCKNNPSGCIYNKDKDVCIETKTCQLEKDLEYTLSGSTTKYKGSLSCRAYNEKISNKTYYVKQLKVSTSCPSGWVSVGDGYCVNKVPILCNQCSTGFKCSEDSNTGDDLGVCQSEEICGSGSYCGLNPTDSTKYACLKIKQKTCDCCCEIGQDARDCCAPLKCAGTCGSDATDDGQGYGRCSGCSAVGTTQAQHDAACNCDTTSGKFCDTSTAGGVCVDCASLDEAGCSLHSDQCCFSQVNNVCQGGNGKLLPGGKCAYYDCDANNKNTCNQTAATTGQFLATSTCVTSCASESQTACDLAGADSTKCSSYENCCFDAKNKKCVNGTEKINQSGINYCSYYNCAVDNKNCDVASASTTGTYLGLAKCQKNCKSTGTLTGATCASDTAGICNIDFCGNPYSCLTSSGSTPSSSECGFCCCKPGDTNGTLTCLADKGDCNGSNRGLFCGCKADSECNSISQGCGSDTCCHGRPNVASTSPKNNQDKVCRNNQIVINFDQLMNTGTLANNILLIEEKDYGSGICANGTIVSLNNFKPKSTNLLVRLYQAASNNFKNLLNRATGNAIAAAPSADKLYCIVSTTVNSKTSYVNGATSTTAYIKPQRMLLANNNYFVVVKGDENLDSNSGVTSENKVGLNASGLSPVTNPQFNGVAFKNSYTFGFKTLGDNDSNNGLCTINKVITDPGSFLIKSADNDPSDDVPGSANFDKADDNDRLVSAFAYSADDQLLQPISGYMWNWNWRITDTSVANNLNITGLTNNEIVVGGVAGVTDKSTQVVATVNMLGFKNATFTGDGLSGVSDLYVFLCSNPWPAEINGKWNPWTDQCTDAFGNNISGCVNYNYKFYYCRDAGKVGTADDLPAVTNPALILGSSGNLICSTDGTSCSKQNAACGDNGTCIWNVLKESYFFREAIPTAGEIWEIKSTGASGQVSLSWYTPINVATPITSYKIYYGPTSGKASSYITSLSLKEASCKVKDNKNYCSYIISGLVNGQTYSFKVSALTDKKTESLLSGSKEIIPTDTTAPAQPTGLSAKLTDTKLIISWNANNDDTMYYRLFHGLFSGKIAESIDTSDKTTSLSLDRSNYRSGDHFFHLAAVDDSGNTSLLSNELKVTIPAVSE